MEREVEEQIEVLKRHQQDINRAFEEEIRLLKLGQEETKEGMGELNKRMQALADELSGNVKNLVNSNNSVRVELTKFTDYFLEERRESERREHEAKERDAQAKRDAEERADRMRTENRNNIYKLVGTLLGSSGLVYVLVMAWLA